MAGIMDDPRTPPTAAAAEEPLHPPEPAQVSTGKGVKETIESILIAFILAFIFRGVRRRGVRHPHRVDGDHAAGAHMRFTCKDCGYRFDVNYSTGSGGRRGSCPAKAIDSDGQPLTFRDHLPELPAPRLGR